MFIKENQLLGIVVQRNRTKEKEEIEIHDCVFIFTLGGLECKQHLFRCHNRHRVQILSGDSVVAVHSF